MVQTAKTNCSPYLLKQRRALWEVCLQVRAAHGQPVLPCGRCGLADICRREPLANAPAVRCTGKTLPETFGRVGAVTLAK